MNNQWADKWLLENFNKRDLAGLERMYRPDVKFVDVPLAVEVADWAGTKAFLGGFFAPDAGQHPFFPEAYLGTEREGVVEWVWKGTMGTIDLFQIGPGFEGRTFSVKGNSVFRFDDNGLVAEERDYWDVATVIRQIKG